MHDWFSKRKNTKSQIHLPAISDHDRLAKLHGFIPDSASTSAVSKTTPLEPLEGKNTPSVDKNLCILGKVDVSQKSYKKFEKELRSI